MDRIDRTLAGGLGTFWLVLIGTGLVWMSLGRSSHTSDEPPVEPHLKRLGVDQWHAHGHRGRGVKVAVLDSGFMDYPAFLGTALPAQVTVRSFRHDGQLQARDSQHGILCGEVIHTIAPEAELLLANWEPDQPAQFLEAVAWAREQARIISCSVVMPGWSDGTGQGPIPAALGRLLGDGSQPDDVLMFVSAGNLARRTWIGSYQRGRHGYHDWGQGHSLNRLVPWDEGRVSIDLSWPPDQRGFVLEVVTDGPTRQVMRAKPGPIASVLERRPWAPDPCRVTLSFRPEAKINYQVRVRPLRGAGGRFRLMVLGASLRRSTAQGSIPFPGDGPLVQAVGAVRDDGQRYSYSSCGWQECCAKPDFAAPVPFPSRWRPQPFVGTSAAAPQAAGVAALLWSRYPHWTAGQVREALRRHAVDLGPPGHDSETGHGRVSLPPWP